MSTDGQTTMAKWNTYEVMIKYYELCVPGVETKNPHFFSSLHVVKRDSTVEVIVNNATSSNAVRPATPFNNSSNQPDKVATAPTTSVSQLKLLLKGKKDNKLQVKCSCNDITDGSAIKRKFLIKCSKCEALVHGKCHNLNAQLFNNNSNHSTNWYCSKCTIDMQSEAASAIPNQSTKPKKTTSPTQSNVSSKSNKAPIQKSKMKKDITKCTTTPVNPRSNQKTSKPNDNVKCGAKNKGKSSKDLKKPSRRPTTNQRIGTGKNTTPSKRRFVPIKPKQT